MRCPRCGADNSAGMKFCGQCGASLGSACPSCGSENPPDHRFCGHCGAPLDPSGLQDSVSPEPFIPKPVARSALPGEIKQVTVLFCDIVGSVQLTERLGAEAMRDLVSSFLATSLREVQRYGGNAPQFTGDGFMALFGAPVTQEDHVRRALLAAIAIQRALSRRPDAADFPKLEVPVRMGVHTGPVVFGPVGGSLRMDATAIGDTANVAARLQEAAEPGTILMSETTRRMAQGYARVELVGPLILKGKDAPVRAYRLLGVSHRRAGLREVASAHTTTFVDRESERAILHNFLRLVESGRSQAVGIVGEPGIGKSRLLAEFRRELADERVSWVEGRCVSYGTAIPYWLLLDLLRSNSGIIETDTPDIISEKVRLVLQQLDEDAEQNCPILLHLLGIGGPGSSPALLNPEAVKAKAFEIFRQVSIKASLRRTLVLVLEDLHWVDKVSEEFLGFLAENAPGARILLLGTYRPGYSPPWIHKSYAGQTPLQPLSRDDSVKMVRSVLSAGRLIDLVTEEIVAKADGNPFFLEQLALHAGEATDVRPGLTVPDSIHDVVMARIDRLPDETKQVLQTAAVIGREFSSRLLSAVWKGAGPLEATLRELTLLEFISMRVGPEDATYVFRHALTQETAYGTLLERHRRAHHAAVGHALEELYRDRAEEVAELLAFHFGRSDYAEKAVDYAILAGERAQRRWANEEALTYFSGALLRLDRIPDTHANRLRRIDAVLKQAEVKYALGRYTEHIRALEEVRSIVEQADDPPRRAAWHYWVGFLQSVSGGKPDLSIGHCRQASQIASAHGLDEIEAFAESCLAQVYLVAGRLRDAIEAGELALSSFELRGNRWWAGRTLWHLSSAANFLGEWEVSVNYCKRGLGHGEALNDLRLRTVGWSRLGLAYINQGDLERGLECCEEALALAPIPRDAAWTRVVRGYGQIKAGQLSKGLARLREALGWFESAQMRWTQLVGMAWLIEGHLRLADRGSARPLIDHLLETTRAGGNLHYEGRGCWLMAECLADTSPTLAEDYNRNAMRIFKAVGARNDLARAMLTQSALRQSAGDWATARSLLMEAATLFKLLGTRDEPKRVEAALLAVDKGHQISLLSGE